MNFDDYTKLKSRCETAGIEDCPALTQLLHLLQAKHAAQDYWKAYLNRMNKWEQNCARDVEKMIREVENGDSERLY